MTSIIFLHTLILLIWFKTDAFIVYSKLLKLNKLSHIDKWENVRDTVDCSVTYHQYLRMTFPNNFWVKLLTCPICLGVWLCIPTLILSWTIVPQVCVISLFLYYLIVKLM